MSRKTLSGTKPATFDPIPADRWYPVAISKAKTATVKSEGANKGLLRLALELRVQEPNEFAGRALFDGGMLEGESQSPAILLARLIDYRGDVDWGDFEFPEPDEDQSDLEEALVGVEGYAFVTHRPDEKTDRINVNISRFSVDEPEGYSDEADDDEYADDEDDEEEVADEAPIVSAPKRSRSKVAVEA